MILVIMRAQYILTDIILDYREKELIEKLKSRMSVSIGNLPVDIILGEIAIERKSFLDFEQSIIDGRLFEQLSVLKNYKIGILALELGVPERLHINSYYGAIAKIISMNISILNYRDMDELINIIESLAKIKTEDHVIVRKKNKNPLLNILTSFPGIGERRYVKIIENFESIKDFVNADKDRLMNVFGKKVGENLYNIMNDKLK